MHPGNAPMQTMTNQYQVGPPVETVVPNIQTFVPPVKTNVPVATAVPLGFISSAAPDNDVAALTNFSSITASNGYSQSSANAGTFATGISTTAEAQPPSNSASVGYPDAVSAGGPSTVALGTTFPGGQFPSKFSASQIPQTSSSTGVTGIPPDQLPSGGHSGANVWQTHPYEPGETTPLAIGSPHAQTATVTPAALPLASASAAYASGTSGAHAFNVAACEESESEEDDDWELDVFAAIGVAVVLFFTVVGAVLLFTGAGLWGAVCFVLACLVALLLCVRRVMNSPSRP